MDLDTVKTLHHQFHVTPMSGIDAKVLTDPKLKQTTDEKSKQKIKQNPQLFSLLQFLPTLQQCEFSLWLGGKINSYHGNCHKSFSFSLFQGTEHVYKDTHRIHLPLKNLGSNITTFSQVLQCVSQ